MIERDGFDLRLALKGQLGKGVYVARYDKALRFAENGAWHHGSDGGLIKVHVNVQNPKYVSDSRHRGRWWEEGHDACRVDRTPVSSNMEWCIRDPAQIRVLSITRIPVTSLPDDEVPPPMVIYDDDDYDEESDEAEEEGEARRLEEERVPLPQEERAPSPQSPSIGERLAGFGGDVELLTGYHQGLIDSDGEPTEHAVETGYDERGDDEENFNDDDGEDDDGDGDSDGHDDDGEDDGGDDDGERHDDDGDDDHGDDDGHDDGGHDDGGGDSDGGGGGGGYSDYGGGYSDDGGGYSDDGGGYSDDGGGYYSD